MKQTKNNKNKKIGILVGVLIVIVVISFTIYTLVRQQKEKKTEQENTYDIPMETVKEWEEIQLEEVKLSHIKLKKEQDTYVIIATTKNTSKETIKGFPILIQLKDKEENEIAQIGAYINEMEPKASNILNTSVAADLSKAEKITISRQE